MKRLLLFLLCCTGLISCAAQPEIKITVYNPSDIDRQRETVEINFDELPQGLAKPGKGSVAVYDAQDKEIPSQLIYEGKAAARQLIFQVDIAAGDSLQYTIRSRKEAAVYPSKVYGRFAPERYDDYFWENDLMAYRIYGLALVEKDGPSNGLDVLVKHTDQFFMDKIYKDYTENKISYHVDHGLGVDCYKVGRTLGCGAMAPFAEGKLWLGLNYAGYTILDNGPIRTSVQLNYNAFDVNGTPVTESRIFSLDAGAQLNKVTEIFDGFTGTAPVAAGIVLKNEGKPADAGKEDPNHQPVLAPEAGYIIYSEVGDKSKPDHDNGTIYTAVVFDHPLAEAKVEQQHVLAVTAYTAGTPLTYYTGAGWSKRNFETAQQWTDYISAFAGKLRQPLQVKIK